MPTTLHANSEEPLTLRGVFIDLQINYSGVGGSQTSGHPDCSRHLPLWPLLPSAMWLVAPSFHSTCLCLQKKRLNWRCGRRPFVEVRDHRRASR